MVERIVHLRQICHFGPARVAMYLKRYHDVEISSSGVWRFGHQLRLGRLPANQRPKRYEKQRPGHRVQIDVKLRRPHRRGHDQAALPVHSYRRLHPTASAAHLPQRRPAHRNRVPRLPDRAAPVPDRTGPDRLRRRVPGPASAGTSATAASATPASRQPQPGSTARSNANNASTPRSPLPAPRRRHHRRHPTCSTTGSANGRTTCNFERPHGSLDGQTPYERLKQKTQPTLMSTAYVSSTASPSETRSGWWPRAFHLLGTCQYAAVRWSRCVNFPTGTLPVHA